MNWEIIKTELDKIFYENIQFCDTWKRAIRKTKTPIEFLNNLLEYHNNEIRKFENREEEFDELEERISEFEISLENYEDISPFITEAGLPSNFDISIYTHREKIINALKTIEV